MVNRTYYTPRTAIPNDIDLHQDIESTFCCFDKGYTPPPFSLEHVLDNDGEPTGEVKVKFELTPFAQTCNCQIECTTSSLVFSEEEDPEIPVGQFCPADVEFEVVLPSVLFTETDPTGLIFNFEDTSGNQTSIEVSSLAGVIAQSPLTLVIDEGPRKHIQVGTPITTAAFVSLAGIATQYQIERYVRHESSREVWVDWTPIPTAKSFMRGGKDLVHWDRDVRSGVEYGYRVRFRSTFDHSSKWSAWNTRTA